MVRCSLVEEGWGLVDRVVLVRDRTALAMESKGQPSEAYRINQMGEDREDFSSLCAVPTTGLEKIKAIYWRLWGREDTSDLKPIQGTASKSVVLSGV